MMDWIRETEELLFHGKLQYVTDRQLLHHLLRGQHAMALDFTKINAAVARVDGDVAKLVAALPNPAQAAADQTALDALAGTLDTSSTAAETALAPPAPPTPPAA